jgi:hypothetical protein
MLAAVCVAGGALAGDAAAGAGTCEDHVARLAEEQRADLLRMLEVLGVSEPRDAGPSIACRMGGASPEPVPGAARDGRPPDLTWRVDRAGLVAWLEVLSRPGAGAPRGEPLRAGWMALYREVSWYPGAGDGQGPEGDVLRVHTEWRDRSAAARFARAVERGLRGGAPALDRLRDWRLRAGGHRVSVELLAERPMEVTPLEEDPWEDVEFGRSAP